MKVGDLVYVKNIGIVDVNPISRLATVTEIGESNLIGVKFWEFDTFYDAQNLVIVDNPELKQLYEVTLGYIVKLILEESAMGKWMLSDLNTEDSNVR